MVNNIGSNLVEFNKAIVEKRTIDVDKSGRWYRVNWFMRIVYCIFSCLNDHRLTRVANAFNRFLDELEKTPAKFKTNANQPAAKQNIDVAICQIASRSLSNALSRCHKDKAKQALKDLQQRVIAFNYRYEAENGGINKIPNAFAPVTLCKIALAWKKSQEIMDGNDKLTPKEEAGLVRLAQYPEFVAMISKPENASLKERTMKWVVRDHLSPDVLVEFPAKAERIHQCRLQHRLGYYTKTMLEVLHKSNEKHVAMLVDDKMTSIMDEKTKVDLGGGCVRTIKNILDQFEDKNHSWGEVEILQDGVVKHSTIDLRDSIDLSDANAQDWWEQAKCLKHLCIRTLSLAEAQARYGSECDGKTWGGRVMATRQVKDLEARGTHAYIEIGIPDAKGNYRVFTFGKSAKQLPRSPWDYATTVAKTFDGRIISPDPSPFNPIRQHWGLPFSMTHAEGQKVMAWIRKSIIEGVNDNMAYQLFIDNCTKWDLELGDILDRKRIPKDIFQVHFHRSKPPGAMGYIFKKITKLGHRIENLFLSGLFAILGSSSSKTIIKNGKKVKVSLSERKPWTYPHNNKFNIPAVLMENQEKGLFKCSKGKP